MTNVQSIQVLVSAKSEIVRQLSAMADLLFESEPSPSLASFLRSASSLGWYFDRCRKKAAVDGVAFTELEKQRPAGANDPITFPKSAEEFAQTAQRIQDLTRAVAMDLVAAEELTIAANVLEDADSVVRFFDILATAAEPAGNETADHGQAALREQLGEPDRPAHHAQAMGGDRPPAKSIPIRTVTTFTYELFGPIQVRQCDAKCQYLIEGSAPLDAFKVHQALSAELRANPPHPEYVLDSLTIHSRAASVVAGEGRDVGLQATAMFVRPRRQAPEHPSVPAA